MTSLATDPVTETVGARTPLLIAALGTVYVAWGSTYLAVRIMVNEMPAVLGSGLRALAAGALIAAFLTAWGGAKRLRVTSAQLAGCAVVGLLMPVMGQGLVAIAEDGGATSGLTALLVAGVPLWVACIRTLSGDRPGVPSLVGVIIGFGGAAALIADNSADGAAPTWALLLVVLASMAWACGSWLHPRLRLPADPFAVVVYEMLIGGGVLTIVGISRGEAFTPGSYSAQAWAAWAFLVLVGSVLGLTAYNWLLQSTSVSLAATYAYVNPVVAVFLGWLILSEPVTGSTLVGAAVVVAGVALVVASEARDKAEHHQPRQESTA